MVRNVWADPALTRLPAVQPEPVGGVLGEAVGASVGVALGEAVGLGDADDGAALLDSGAAVAGLEVIVGVEQAEMTTSRANTPGKKAVRRIGLVRVVAEVGGGNGRHGTVAEQADLAAEEVELSLEADRGIGEFEQLLLAGQLHLENAADRVACGDGVVGKADRLEDLVQGGGHV